MLSIFLHFLKYLCEYNNEVFKSLVRPSREVVKVRRTVSAGHRDDCDVTGTKQDERSGHRSAPGACEFTLALMIKVFRTDARSCLCREPIGLKRLRLWKLPREI